MKRNEFYFSDESLPYGHDDPDFDYEAVFGPDDPESEIYYNDDHEYPLREPIRLVERGPIDFDVLRGMALTPNLNFHARGLLLFLAAQPEGTLMSAYDVARYFDMPDDDIADSVDWLVARGYVKPMAVQS